MSKAVEETPLARSLHQMITPLVNKCDQSVDSVLQSQDVLNKQIEDLSKELAGFLDDASLASLQPHLQKLVGIRKRVGDMNAQLRTVQGRLGRMRAVAQKNGLLVDAARAVGLPAEDEHAIDPDQPHQHQHQHQPQAQAQAQQEEEGGAEGREEGEAQPKQDGV